MSTAIHQSTIAALWPRVRGMFDRLMSAIGTPAAVALLSFTSARARRTIVQQLARVEIYVRKLLLAEAALLMPQKERGPRLVEIPLRASGLYAPAIQPTRRLLASRRLTADLTRPDAWTVTFALAFPRDERAVAEAAAPHVRSLWGSPPSASPLQQAQPRRLRADAVRIARRLEALRRVLNDPAPHARRFARAYRRADARTPNLITRYAFATPRLTCVNRHDPRLDVDIQRAGWIACDTS